MIDGDDDIIAHTNRILARMSSGEPFRPRDLWDLVPEQSRSVADLMIQQWRRRGWIEYRREDGNTLWTLTDAGRAAVRKEPADV